MKKMNYFSLSRNGVAPLLALLLLQSLAVRRAYASRTSPKVPAVIALGDSILDPGNNNKILTLFKSNFQPYGRDFPRHRATGRFCNGKIPTDFIASKLGVKETLPAYSNARWNDFPTGVSFASAGSGYDPTTSQISAVVSFSKQVDMFKEYKQKLIRILGQKKAARIVSESLYLLCGGSNDVVVYLTTHPKEEQDIRSYARYLTQTAYNLTEELVGLGARRIAVFGAPPIGCVPSQRTLAGGLARDCAEHQNQLAQMFNSMLSREVPRLGSRHEGTDIIYIDIYNPLLELLQHPQKYGFEESTKGCCGSGLLEAAILCNSLSNICKNTSSYVFWDSYHPTERAYKIIVDQLVQKYIGHLVG